MLKKLAKQIVAPWHCCIRFAFLLILLLIPPAASASLLFYSPLAKAAGNIETLIKGKVNKIDKVVQYQPLKNGKKIETSTHFSYQVEVLAVLYGDVTHSTLQIGHSSFVPIVYNDEGKPIMMFSPVLDGSGLESRLQEGNEYLLSIGKVANDATREIPLYRAELPEKESILLELIYEGRAWKHVRKMLSNELPQITAYRFDAKSRRLYLFQGASRTIYCVQDNALLQYKRYADSSIRVNHLDIDDRNHLLLLFNQEQQGVVGYDDFQPVMPSTTSQ
ncbi:MAG TPA: hypothetical protein VK165_01070 [Azonexus sp.]|nr:hypothetical protein [Azonexus sp.]HZW25739.1 hypothetical protein [Gallionella sp.]